MADSYVLGTPVRVSATWTVDGTATDPTTVKLRYRRDGRAETVDTYGGAESIITRVSAGSYRADIVPDHVGKWLYRWEGTGAATGASEGSFTVTSIYV